MSGKVIEHWIGHQVETCQLDLVVGSVFPRKPTLGHIQSPNRVYGLVDLSTAMHCNGLRGQNRVFGVNVRMGVVSRLTDRYCDRAQVLMEITTGGKLSFRTLPLAV